MTLLNDGFLGAWLLSKELLLIIINRIETITLKYVAILCCNSSIVRLVLVLSGKSVNESVLYVMPLSQ